ncbi:ribosome-associated translation inhibitor RaiA [Microbacterium betulae]|uniref:Ribosome hibernation promoting factor n=1 Tax=Microbacterium betulae TaxID=2981139 RepID=A0AA97FJN2_9MICO|nr:ribosome-associated translation inhibitor RaiA [Microbacterium sp. AB]WOF24208.1 ribosome-associated translation inhibitor RaiA [Microbacterium sp. AB]
MDTNIVGVGVSVSDRFRTVVEEKSERISTLAPRAERLEVKVTHQSHRAGRLEEETVELTVFWNGPVIRAEAHDADKFTAFDIALEKLGEQLRRAKDKKVSGRLRPRAARFAKETGELEGLDVQPAAAETLQAVATGEVAVVAEREEDEAYTPVVIRTKSFEPEWMTVEDAVDRMELVGHDFFLFIDARTDHPSVVYRRRGWDYGVISLTTQASPVEDALAS